MRPAIRISDLPALSPEADRILVQAILPDGSRLEAAVEFTFFVTSAEIADLQWYFETFLQFDDEPAPSVAKRIEQHLRDRGVELFRSVLDSNEEVRALWRAFRPYLADAEFEIVSRNAAGSAIQWEFLQEPGAQEPLSMQMRAFVRVPAIPEPAAEVILAARKGSLRLLLAIERPKGAADVPYRSVAAGLVGMTDARSISIDVVRPAGFQRLEQVLMAAAQAGNPYDILHFDGHGVYGSLGSRPGARGYLVFENDRSPQRCTLVDGRRLGELMVRAGTKTLVLNACRSAYAGPEAAKRPTGTKPDPSVKAAPTVGSLAEEAIRAGVQHVVAMRYNLYVVTATQFVAALYEALGRGCTLGNAVSSARRRLALQPKRTIGDKKIPMQDWAVPALFRADGVTEAPRTVDTSPPLMSTSAESELFVGRHATLYRIDRWLDYRPIILLWGQAGMGKSATAREFARWYTRTGGVAGPTVITSLQERPLPVLSLDSTDPPVIPDFVGNIGERCGLWLIDGLEELTASQLARLRFLALAAAHRGAKVILTARGDPHWDNSEVATVFLPAMWPDQCDQLMHQLPSEREEITGSCIRALLRFSNGNPQVLRLMTDLANAASGIKNESPEHIVAVVASGNIDLNSVCFGGLREVVNKLRGGLDSFRADEKSKLALVHLFRGYVSVASLGTLSQWGLPALAGVTPEILTALFYHLVDAGLAHDFTYGKYGLHPLLPVILRPLFENEYPPGSLEEKKALRAFCGALAKGCSFTIDAYNTGAPFAFELFEQLDASLASAWQISCREGWWSYAINILSARCVTAYETSDDSTLQHLLDEAAPFFVDQATKEPLPGRHAEWNIWMSYRARLLRHRGDLRAADELLANLIKILRPLAVQPLSGRSGPWSLEETRNVSELAEELYQQGAVKVSLGDKESVATLTEAADLARLTYQPSLAQKAAMLKVTAGSLAAATSDAVPPALQQAMKDPNAIVSAHAYMALGKMKLDLVTQLLAENSTDTDELKGHVRMLLLAAKTAFQNAVKAFPPHLMEAVAQAQLQLGQTELQLFDWRAARTSLSNALRGFERVPRPDAAAAARVSLATVMRYTNRPEDAARYMKAALEYYEKQDPSRAAFLVAEYPELSVEMTKLQ